MLITFHSQLNYVPFVHDAASSDVLVHNEKFLFQRHKSKIPYVPFFGRLEANSCADCRLRGVGW